MLLSSTVYPIPKTDLGLSSTDKIIWADAKVTPTAVSYSEAEKINLAKIRATVLGYAGNGLDGEVGTGSLEVALSTTSGEAIGVLAATGYATIVINLLVADTMDTD